MNDRERETLARGYWQAEERIQVIHAGMVIDGDPAELEGKLLEKQDEIEFLLGVEYFKKRQ